MDTSTAAPPPAPFLRPMGEGDTIPVVPDGWSTQRVGSISGDLMEVAFDPERHDLTVVLGGRLDMAVGHAINHEGWAPLACTDDSQIWARDRVDRASERLSRLAECPAPSRGLDLGR